MWPYFTGRLEGHMAGLYNGLKTLWESVLGTTVFSVPSSLDFIFTCNFNYYKKI
jgi:hypothetical protein